MQTFGFTQARKEFAGWAVDLEIAQERQIEILRGKLVEWATTEHAWKPDRPHTEGTIAADVTGLATQLVTVRVSADMDAALWLELARDGKWSWLWQVLVNHADEIGEILAGGAGVMMPGGPERNPDTQELYEQSRADMSAGRSDSRSAGLR